MTDIATVAFIAFLLTCLLRLKLLLCLLASIHNVLRIITKLHMKITTFHFLLKVCSCNDFTLISMPRLPVVWLLEIL